MRPQRLRTLLAQSERPLAIHFEPEFTDDFGPPAVARNLTTYHQAFIVPRHLFISGSKELTDWSSRDLDSHRLIAHDMKAGVRRLAAAGWPIPPTYDDTMIMS